MAAPVDLGTDTLTASPVCSNAEDADIPDEDAGDNAEDLRGSTPDPDVSTNLPILPNEDVKAYGELGWLHAWASQHRRVQLSPSVALLITKVMLEAVQSSWTKPSSVPISTRWLDYLYRT